MLGLQPDDIGLLVSASDPRLSPDGSRVAFSVQRVDRERNRYQTRVRVVSADGATPAVALSPDDVSADLARWSPDGTQIVYAARPIADDDAVSELWLVGVDGSESPRPLTTGTYEASEVAWSPDGRRVAFASGRHDTWDLDWAVDLFVADATGDEGSLQRVTSTGPVYSSPSWAPDGSRL